MEVLTLNIHPPFSKSFKDPVLIKCGMNMPPIKRDPVKVSTIFNIVFNRKQILMTDDVKLATKNENGYSNKIIKQENAGSKVLYTYENNYLISKTFKTDLKIQSIEQYISDFFEQNKEFEITLVEASLNLETIIVSKCDYTTYNYTANYSKNDKPNERKMTGHFTSDFVVTIETTNKLEEIKNLLSLIGKIKCTLKLGTSSDIF